MSNARCCQLYNLKCLLLLSESLKVRDVSNGEHLAVLMFKGKLLERNFYRFADLLILCVTWRLDSVNYLIRLCCLLQKYFKK